MDYSLVLHEPPEVQLEVVAVYLHLLKTIPTKCLQSDTLKQSLQTKLDDTGQN